MRAPTFFALTLGFGLLLGACTEEEDEDDATCSDAQTMRADTILGLTADQTAGADVFAQTCGGSGCHGSDGNSGPAPDLGDEAPEFSADSMACLVLAGVGSMPSQGSLSDQELADVLAYVQATF